MNFQPLTTGGHLPYRPRPAYTDHFTHLTGKSFFLQCHFHANERAASCNLCRFRRIAGKDRVIPQLASRDQRAARRVVDRAGDASRVLPQLPTRTYFRYRLCVTEVSHFFVCLPIFRYKLWLRGVWGDPARSMLMELHSSNYILWFVFRSSFSTDAEMRIADSLRGKRCENAQFE